MGGWVGNIEVNGYEVEAAFSALTIDEVVDPLLDKLDALAEAKGSRVLVFLAAPPGAGKTTFASFLEAYYEESDRDHMLQCIGLDGFHRTNAELDALGLRQVKGAPETFDADALMAKLDELGGNGELTWPVYDRNLHEPVADAVKVEGDIVILEGNWLLLDEEPWSDVADYADYTIFLLADEGLLKEGLVARKQRGGVSREEALAHYDRADGPNIRRALERRLPADVTLRLLAPGEIVFDYTLK